MIVKGKVQLCACDNYRDHFKSFQAHGKYFLFQIYQELENVVNKCVDQKYRHFLAQPELDGNSIQWFSLPYYEEPKRLAELKGQEHDYYEKVKNETLSHYGSVVEKLKAQNKNSEADVLGNAIKFVNDDFVYCFDGKTVLGVWGMELRDEVREPLGIAMKNTFEKPRKNKQQLTGGEEEKSGEETVSEEMSNENEDENENENNEEQYGDEESSLNVRFDSEENGTLRGKTEYKMRRGERITDSMIPDAEANDGYEFIGWDVEPNDHEIVDDVVFTAQFKKKSYKVRFFDGGHGSLLGQTEYDKYYEERVQANEVPKVEPDEGYRFVGWDKSPVNYIVKEDTDFVAQYEEEKGSWWNRFWGWGSGCLNWLLTLLLLGLIGLLLWFLLGNHGFSFCGCDCGCNEQVVVPDTPITPTPDPKIVNPDDPLPPPTENCGVHFSGWYLSDKNEYPWRDCSKIFEKEDFGEYVGQGYYPDNTKILPKSMKHTFDAVAVNQGTHLIIYSKPNFEGREVLNVKGPILIENVNAKGYYDKLMTYTFSGELQKLFPPERRQWSSENMHDWAKGSCKIICE